MTEPPTAVTGVGRGVPDTMTYADVTDLAPVRGFVRTRAVSFGLAPRRADLLMLAVAELATNTLLHTEGGGSVRVWAEAGHVVCDVTDGGPGREFGREMPPPSAISGRGLAIVERICDEVSTSTGPAGTRVRLRMRL